MILVEAKRLGYFGNKRIREGDQFHIKTEVEFSAEWMKKIEPKDAPKAEKPAEKKAKFVDTSDVI